MPGIFESLKKTPLATLNERLSDLAGFFFEISRMKASQVAAQQALQGLQQLGQGLEGPAGEYIRGVAQSLMPLGAVPGVDPTKIAGVYETLAQIKYNEAVNQITKQAVQETLNHLNQVYSQLADTAGKILKEQGKTKTGVKEIDEILSLAQNAIAQAINTQLNLTKSQLETLKTYAEKPGVKLDTSFIDKAIGAISELSSVLARFASPEATIYKAGIAAQIAGQRLAMQQQKDLEKDAQKKLSEKTKLEREIIENSTKIANEMGIPITSGEAIIDFRLNRDKSGLPTEAEITTYDMLTGGTNTKKVSINEFSAMKLLEKPTESIYGKEIAKIRGALYQYQKLLESPTFEDYQKSVEINKGIIQLPISSSQNKETIKKEEKSINKEEKSGFGAFSPVSGEKKEESKKQELPEWAKPTKKQIPGIGRFTF
jgi:hypothetical protein